MKEVVSEVGKLFLYDAMVVPCCCLKPICHNDMLQWVLRATQNVQNSRVHRFSPRTYTSVHNWYNLKV